MNLTSRLIFLFTLLLFSATAFAGEWVRAERYFSKTSDDIYGSTLYCYTNKSNYESCASRATTNVMQFCNAHLSSGAVGYISGPNLIESSYNTRHVAVCDVYVLSDYSGTFPPTPDGEVVYGAPYTDQQCESLYSGSYTALSSDGGNTANLGACTVEFTGVTFCDDTSPSGDVAPSGQLYCTSEVVSTSTGQPNQPTSPPSGTSDIPPYLTETSDPSSCPSGYVGMGGSTYCVDQGAIDDGSISIIGGDVTYPPTDTDDDGIPDSNDPTPGTGGTVGGGSDGTGGTTTEPGGSYGGGGSFGDPGGSSGDGDGDGTDDGACSVFLGGAVCDWLFGVPDEPVQPELPVETITPDDLTVDFDSGLSSTATCPPPEVVNVAFGSFAKTVEIPYTNICTFAEMIRGLVIAAAYMTAAFITYRGVIA